MCGIIYAKRKDKVAAGKAVLKRYHAQKGRGKEGFGILSIKDGKIDAILRFEKEDEAEKALKEIKSDHILFHHRFPTSTPNYKDMTHPIAVESDALESNYYVVHNGVITNSTVLRDRHEERGIKYTTHLKDIHAVETRSGRSEFVVEKFNDSESLAVELALFLEGKQNYISTQGTAAFVCIETDKDRNVQKIHYGRNTGNPLVIEDNNDLFFIKSEGGGKKVDDGEITTIDYASGEKSSRLVNVGYTYVRTAPDDDLPTIGFGAQDRHKGAVISPYNKGLFDERTPSRSVLLRPDDDGPDYSDDFGSWPDSVADHKEQLQHHMSEYRLTDEYLLELWAEIESLEQDMKDCSEKLNDNTLTSEEIIYNQEYMSECAQVLIQKRRESDALEKYLNIKRTKSGIITSGPDPINGA